MKISEQLEILDRLRIIYCGVKLQLKVNDKNELVKDEFGRLEKIVSLMPTLNNRTKKYFNKTIHNAVIVPLGEINNLIGIDVDAKNNTIQQFEDVLDEKEFIINTLTSKTMNNGYHYYFCLNEKQKDKIKDFKAGKGIFNLEAIDIKYNNQCFFEACNLEGHIYEFINSENIQELPEFIFNEITKIANFQLCKPSNKVFKKYENLKELNGKDECIRRLRLYLDCLDKEYFDDYDKWLTVGSIIFNESGNYNLFDEYSKKSKKYDKKSVLKMWNSYKTERDKKATIKRLIEIVKCGCNKLYINAYCNDIISVFDDVFRDVNDYNIGCVFCYYADGDYIYDTINKLWYRFNDFGIWKKYDSERVKLDIAEGLIPIFDHEYLLRSKEVDNDIESKKLYDCYNRCISYLKKNRNREQVLIMLKGKIGDSLVFEKFDNVNNYLIGFENGVYDLKEFKFRIGVKKDYVTCTTGYNYYDKVDDDVTDKVNNFFKEIMPIDEDRIYLLKTISLGIVGVNILEDFYVWIGTGANGKGVLRDLIAQSLGEDYFDNMEIDYLENNKHGVHANSADNIMAKKKNTRLCITTEPEGDVKLKCAKLKQISGNDKVQCRFNYGQLFNFVPKFKLIIQTNLDFKVDGYDGGIRRRLKLIKFPIKFVDKPITEFQRKINRNLKNEIKDDKFKLAFVLLLIKYYKLFIDNDEFKLILPKRIQEDTENFLNENDPVHKFLTNKVDITENEKDKVKMSDLFSLFKSDTNYDSFNISLTKFRTIMENKGIRMKRRNDGIYYLGINLKNKNDVFD